MLYNIHQGNFLFRRNVSDAVVVFKKISYGVIVVTVVAKTLKFAIIYINSFCTSKLVPLNLKYLEGNCATPASQ